LKKYALLFLSFILGTVFGVIFAILILKGYNSNFLNASTVVRLSEIEKLSSEIYKTGEFKSSIIVLNHLSETLKKYEELSNNNERTENLRKDRVLVHGRLYVLYERMAEKSLAKQEFKNAIELLKGEYDIKNEKELRDFIDKADKHSSHQ